MEWFKEVVDKIPWAKATTSMIPLFFIDLLLVYFMIKVHTLNLEYGVVDRFPTNAAFSVFLGVNLFSIVVYLILSTTGVLGQNKIDKIRADSKLEVANQTYHYK